MRTQRFRRLDVTSRIVSLIESNLDDTRFRDRWLRENLLSKFSSPDPTLLKQRQKAALQKWLVVEKRNANTNIRLLLAEPEKVLAGLELGVVLGHARKTIRRLIGAEPPFPLLGKFSGGASTSQKRSSGGVMRKYSSRPDVTAEALCTCLPQLVEFASGPWTQLNPEVFRPRVVPGNVLFFVPKNNKIERVACKEPDLNVMFQKGVGDFLRSRLKRVGIDLDDQRRNQRLAALGARTGEVATLDLSSASDSVTTQLVCSLLPTGWFVYLDSLRCKVTTLPREHRGLEGWSFRHENQMFSSMGNGFTFELESLLFYAIAKAVTWLKVGSTDNVSVFGDDIIVPTEAARPLMCLLNFLGFKVNKAKSFYTGKFRESCGVHCYGGEEVTPFYIKAPVDSPRKIIRVANQLRRWCQMNRVAHETSAWLDEDWYAIWREIVQMVPKHELVSGGYDTNRTDVLVTYAIQPYCTHMYSEKEVLRDDEPAWFRLGSYLSNLHVALKTEPFTGLGCEIVDLGAKQRLGTGVFEWRRLKSRHVSHRRTFGIRVSAFPQELDESTFT